MKFSIVIPSLNQARFLSECLESVLGQEGDFDLEVLVRDGGSNDGTLDVLRRYELDRRLRWVSREDRGQAHAINEGWAEADGDVLAYLNSDDLYLPGALRAVAEAFDARPDWRWLCGRCRIVDRDGRAARSFIGAYKRFMLRPWRPVKLLFENTIPQPAVFLRREAVERAGAMDESLHFTMDYDYWLRLARWFELGSMDRDVACFRVHAESKTGRSIEPSFREAHEVARRHAREWGKPWASWVNFWFYYVRTSLIYRAIALWPGRR